MVGQGDGVATNYLSSQQRTEDRINTKMEQVDEASTVDICLAKDETNNGQNQ